MTILLFTVSLLLISVLAGLLGSLTGLGGGVVLIPMLTLVFKVDIHYAIGTSLISVIATSSGAASAYVGYKTSVEFCLAWKRKINYSIGPIYSDRYANCKNRFLHHRLYS